jgi:lysozyme
MNWLELLIRGLLPSKKSVSAAIVAATGPKPSVEQLVEQAAPAPLPLPKSPVPDICIQFVAKWEGFSGQPYLDVVGIPTIGYGFTYYPDGRKVTMADTPLPRQVADEMLAKHLEKYWKEVGQMCRVPQNERQLSALTAFAYNVGLMALRNSTLLRNINSKAPLREIEKQFLRWNKAKGTEIQGLTNRRKDEYALYVS